MLTKVKKTEQPVKHSKHTDGRKDGQTDGRTDGWTDREASLLGSAKHSRQFELDQQQLVNLQP